MSNVPSTSTDSDELPKRGKMPSALVTVVIATVLLTWFIVLLIVSIKGALGETISTTLVDVLTILSVLTVFSSWYMAKHANAGGSHD